MKITLLITGHIRPSVSADYDELLINGMQLPRKYFEVFDLPNGDKLPEKDDFAGVMISGSSMMLTDGISWLEDSANWLQKQAERNTPILGICFGHQLLAYAFGGKIKDNPNGIEVGTRRIDFNDKAKNDLLLKDFYPSILAQVSHVQSVVELPKDAVVLASSAQEPSHAFRIGENIWGLQFHPEFNAEIIRKIIVSKAEAYPEKIAVERLLTEVEETPGSYNILKRFGEIINLTQRH
ncbi:MAG: glutamine amidotransferase [Candidatus Cloacimonadales bacterium]|nr:glutamine amidotransferase [Candidatus Cloacimonadales bacterium]